MTTNDNLLLFFQNMLALFFPVLLVDARFAENAI
jgi:hypothetical protein